MGEREKACDTYRESIRLDPNSLAYGNLPLYLIAAGHLDEARQFMAEWDARSADSTGFHQLRYALGFLDEDSSSMANELAWFTGKPDENLGLSLASDSEAYAGRLAKAQELSRQAADVAVRVDQRENGAIWLENAGLREAAFGNTAHARQWAEKGLKLFPGSLGVRVEAPSRSP